MLKKFYLDAGDSPHFKHCVICGKLKQPSEYKYDGNTGKKYIEYYAECDSKDCEHGWHDVEKTKHRLFGDGEVTCKKCGTVYDLDYTPSYPGD